MMMLPEARQPWYSRMQQVPGLSTTSEVVDSPLPPAVNQTSIEQSQVSQPERPKNGDAINNSFLRLQ